MKKKWTCFILMVVLCLSLPACGGKTIPSDRDDDPSSPESAYAYQLVHEKLPGEMVLAVSQCADDQSIYLCGMDAGSKPLLYNYRYDNGDLQSYPIPSDISYLHVCCPMANGVAVVAGDYPAYWKNAQKYDVENRQDQYALFLLLFDQDGGLETSIPLDLPYSQGACFYSLLYTDSCFYLLDASTLYQISTEGEILNQRHLEGGLFISQALSPQGLAVALYRSSLDGGDNAAHVERLVSPQQFTFETVYSDPNSLLAGIGFADDRMLLRMNGELVQLSPGDGEIQTVFRFRENGISAPYDTIYQIGTVLFLAGRNQSGIDYLAYGEIPKTEELLLWAPYSAEMLPALVSGFNRDNSRYHIQVEYVDPNDPAVQARIIAGEGPDLFFTGTGSMFTSYQNEAVFEDLLPYLDNSTVVNRDSLFPSVLEAVMLDGKLYTLPIDMELYTMVCTRPDLVTEEMSFLDTMSLPEIESGSMRFITAECSRTIMWEWLSNMYQANHIDSMHGTCEFDTPEYVDLLKSCMLATPDESGLSRDEVPYLFYHDSFPGLGRLLFWQVQCGDHFCFAPGMGVGLTIPDAFSIAKASPHKEGAWAFMEYAFTQDLPDDPRFVLPASKASLTRLLESGKTTGFWYDPELEYIKLDDYTVSIFNELLSRPVALMNRYPELTQIINEEAEKFFAGECSAEDAASATQSRAAIFMAERYG